NFLRDLNFVSPARLPRVPPPALRSKGGLLVMRVMRTRLTPEERRERARLASDRWRPCAWHRPATARRKAGAGLVDQPEPRNYYRRRAKARLAAANAIMAAARHLACGYDRSFH